MLTTESTGLVASADNAGDHGLTFHRCGLVQHRGFRGGVPQTRLHFGDSSADRSRHGGREVTQMMMRSRLSPNGFQSRLEIGVSERFVVQVTPTKNRNEQKRIRIGFGVGVRVCFHVGADVRRDHHRPRLAAFRGVDGPPNTRRPASNLTRAVNQFLANGFTAQQVSDILHYAADNVCPQYHDVIVQTVSSW